MGTGAAAMVLVLIGALELASCAPSSHQSERRGVGSQMQTTSVEGAEPAAAMPDHPSSFLEQVGLAVSWLIEALLRTRTYDTSYRQYRYYYPTYGSSPSPPPPSPPPSSRNNLPPQFQKGQ